MTDSCRRAYLAASPSPGARVDLDPEESHHVARVLRLKPGEALHLIDGKGGAWAATIVAVARDRVSVVIGDALAGEVDPELRVVLYQALSRPEKIEWVLRKGTEIGVSAFRLVASERVDAPPPSPARLARYERIVMEACKQSGRRRLPSVALSAIDTPTENVLAIVLAFCAGVPPLGMVLADPRREEVWFAVGPEGGLSESEIAALTARGWSAASLGPRVLRTETAGTVAAAIVLHAWGDLGRCPSSPPSPRRRLTPPPQTYVPNRPHDDARWGVHGTAHQSPENLLRSRGVGPPSQGGEPPGHRVDGRLLPLPTRSG
jgi:16S rRNA (uracil1498-N3)-methyltransferase